MTSDLDERGRPRVANDSGTVDLSEVRRKRFGADRTWPVGAVVSELARELVDKTINPCDIVVAYRERLPGGGFRTVVLAGGESDDPHASAGMLQDAAWLLLRGGRGG